MMTRAEPKLTEECAELAPNLGRSRSRGCHQSFITQTFLHNQGLQGWQGSISHYFSWKLESDIAKLFVHWELIALANGQFP